MFSKNLQVLQNRYGVYYIADSSGIEQYYCGKILASPDKIFIEKTLERINNGTFEKWYVNECAKQYEKARQEYKDASNIEAVKYRG